MKHIACRDLGFDCNHEVNASTEAELLQQVADHAVNVHHVEVTPEVVLRVKALIQDREITHDPPSPAQSTG